MIRLPEVALPKVTAVKLKTFQSDVDSKPNYVEQVTAAKTLFKSRNTKDNSVFKVVRAKLTEMCGEAGRCCYCEVSQPRSEKQPIRGLRRCLKEVDRSGSRSQ